MRRISAVCILFSASFFIFAAAEFASAATIVSDPIIEDMVWTANDSPYHVNSITISASSTLTIEPGTIVKFTDNARVRIEGSIDAQGTDTEPIYFTSVHDDTIGGDSNGNGTSTVPGSSRQTSVGWRDTRWGGMQFVEGASGTFDNAVFRYAGYDHTHAQAIPALYNTGGDITVTNSEFSDHYAYGIGQKSGSITIRNSRITDSTNGVVQFGGPVTISDSEFVENLRGIFSQGADDLTLTNNVFTDNTSVAVEVDLSASRSFVHEGNVATGGLRNGIILRGPIEHEITLSGDDQMPFIIDDSGGLSAGTFQIERANNLTIAPGGVMNMEPGTVIKLTEDADLSVKGELHAVGTASARITFTSIRDNSVGGVSWDHTEEGPSAEDWEHIQFVGGSKGIFEHVSVLYAGGGYRNRGSRAGIYNTGGVITLQASELAHHRSHGLKHAAGTSTITESTLHDLPGFGVYNETSDPLDARNNYWGHSSGPRHNDLNPDGQGVLASDDVLFEPWLGAWPPESAAQCCSSVLFLPGIMSTRLSENGERRWEPGGEGDIERLYLDEHGKSQNDIEIEAVIGTFDGPSLANIDIYRSFLHKLEEARTDGDIAAYTAHPYDWRLSFDDILADGAIVNEVRRLATSSHTEKVTIVAHSNGGLLAKALVNQLGDEASSLIDQIIFVGVPQLGTPQAIGALLHGFEAGVPFRYSSARARDFAQNAPMSYQLLPQSDYYRNSGADISTPLVTFEDGSETQKFIDEYGYAVSNSAELHEFLVGDERSDPAYADLKNPARVNEMLLTNAETAVSEIGSDWQPPTGIDIHQIAGTGELTLSGITYKTVDHCDRAISVLDAWYCASSSKSLTYSPVRTIDGDGTVVAPSALAMSDASESVKRWWINLNKYNDENLNRDHKNLFEITEVYSLIFDYLIKDEELPSFKYIDTSAPDTGAGDQLTFILHSPLAMSFVDDEGNIVSETYTESNEALFHRYGEVQVLDVYEDESFTVQLDGLAEGSFALEIIEYEDGQTVSTTTFSAIPTSTTTTAKMEFTRSSIEAAGELEVDYDGDGSTDIVLEPETGETITAPEVTIDSLASSFKQYVREEVRNKWVRRQLIRGMDRFLEQHSKHQDVKEKLRGFLPFFHFVPTLPNSSIYLINLKTKVRVYARMGRIKQSDAKGLLHLIMLIEERL